MGSVEEEPRSYASGYLSLVLALSLVVAAAVVMLAALPEVSGWGEALALIGLSALANASVTPEIGRFRMRREAKKILIAFVGLHIGVGFAVGSHVVGRLATFNMQIWAPSGLSLGQVADEVFRMAIGVSPEQNLLPAFAWAIAFHGVFLAAMTGLSYWVLAPSTGLVVLGFLWKEGQPVGAMGYVFTFLVAVCLGLDGLLSSARRVELRGLPASLLAGKRREVLLAGAIVVLVACIVPDVRDLTGFDEVWKPAGEGSSQAARATLKFSTVFRFGGDLRPDPSPAFLVRSPIPLYWRGYVFDTYTGREFELEKSTAYPHLPGDVLPSSYLGVENLSTAVEQDFAYLATFPGVLFAAYEPRAVYGPDSFEVTDSGVLLTMRPNPEGTSYRVVSDLVRPEPDVLREASILAEPDPRYLQRPDELPARVGELARTLTQGLDNAFDKAIAIARYLRTLRYDIGAAAAPVGRDVVDYFLFDSQVGYCQHFAAAMVMMCRELGIPARVVTGFGSGTFDASEQAYRVLQLNFHAWVEVQFEGFGWVSFDPTNGGVGGPEVFDAAESNAIMDGSLPYYGTVESRPTRVYLTRVPDYVSGEETFRIEGAVVQTHAEMKGVPRVPINVTLNVSGMDIFPVMVMPRDALPILVAPTWTGSDGTFSALCALPYGVARVADKVSIRVACLGDDLNEPSDATVTIPLRERAVVAVEVLKTPEIVLVVTLLGPEGPVPDQAIMVFLDEHEIGNYLTNASGMFSLRLEAGPGTHIIAARYAGNELIGAASSVVKVDFPSPEGREGRGNAVQLVSLAAVIITVPVAFVLFRLRAVRRLPASIAEAYRRMLRIFARAGFPRAESMTPYEYASWLEQRSAPGHGEARAITERFVESTYAGIPVKQEELAWSAMALSKISEDLGRQGLHLDAIRRWLGSFVSFLSGLLPWRTS